MLGAVVTAGAMPGMPMLPVYAPLISTDTVAPRSAVTWVYVLAVCPLIGDPLRFHCQDVAVPSDGFRLAVSTFPTPGVPAIVTEATVFANP